MKNIYTSDRLPARVKTLIVAALAAFTGIASFAQTPVAGNFSNFTYMERTAPVLIAPAFTLTGGSSYTDGYIRFEIPSSGGTETLALTSATVPTASGAISLDGNSLYLGQGGGNKVRIGEIDAAENGLNGNPLKIKITFVRTFPNASFEDGLGGWTVYNQLYSRQNDLNGMEIPIRPGESDCAYTYGKVRIATSPSGTSYQVSQTTDQSPTDGIYCIRLYNYGTVPAAYGANCREAAYSIFGPIIVSNAFSAYNGDIFSVDWKAAAGGDWYDVLGYLLGYGSDKTWGTADDTRTLMFGQRGSYSPWQTSNITIPSDGEYKFEFVSGSYDRSGGTVLGATLYVDNLKLISGAMVGVDDATMQTIARQVTYHNSTCETPANQAINITALNTAGNTGSASASVIFTPVNCPPIVSATELNPAFVENSAAVSLYSDVTVTNIESGQAVTIFHFAVTGVKDGSSEVLSIDGSPVQMVNGTTGTTADNGIDYSVLVSGETATLVFSKATGISSSALKQLMEQLKYSNLSGNPAAGSRIISLTYVRDNGGTENGGIEETAMSINSAVTVKPATTIALFSGNGQTAEVTGQITDFVVLTTTADAIPVSGREVSFTISSAPIGSTGQSITVNTILTDADGRAATKLTLGTVAGLYTVTAASVGLSGSPISFTATALPAAIDADVSAVNVDGTEFTAGQYVTVTITPKDQYGNNVGTGKTVVVMLDGVASDVDGPVNVTDNGDGSYTATVRLSGTSAANVITASADGVELSASYDLTVAPGDAFDIVVGSIVAHTYGNYQDFTITVRDQYQNQKSDYTGTVGFSSDDSGAILPAPFTFGLSDAGTTKFTGEVKYSKAGTFNLVATDADVASVTGNQTSIVVSKRMLQVTAANQSKSYGSANPELTIGYSGFITGEDEDMLDTRPAATTDVHTTTPAGTYNAAITVAGGSDSRYDFTYTAADFEVLKAMLTVTADPVTKVYGEANPALSYEIAGFVAGETAAVLIAEPVVSTAVTAASDAGTYADAITVAGGSATNYDFTYNAADFEVTKATLTVTAHDKTKVYGQENPVLTFSYSGFVAGQDESVIDTTPVVYTIVRNDSPVAVYTAALVPDGGIDNNYEFSYVAANIEVTKAMLTVTANDQTKVYGSENPELTVVYTGFANNEDEAVIGTKPVAATAINISTDSGIYEDAITVAGGDDVNYDFTYVPADFTVARAMLIVTAEGKTKVYGSENPELTFTYAGFVNGQDEDILDIAPEVATTVTTLTDAGIYTDAITVSGGLDSNYDFTYVNAGFEVTKALLTVTADSKTRVYGSGNPELTFIYTGFVLSEDEDALDTEPVVTTSADQYSDTGTYPITVSGGESENYEFIYQEGTLTIIKADQTIEFDELPEGLRISEEHLLVATASSGLVVGFEVITSETGSISGNTLRVVREGTLSVSATQPGDNNWNAATAVVRTTLTLPTFNNISSLFTPNSDGMNDFWYIPDLYEMGQVHVKVYNRFGKLVYESSAYNNDWDGTWNGKPLPSASYYYIINSPVRGITKGTVNIIR